MDRVSAAMKGMAAIGSLALVAGCMVPPLSETATYPVVYRAEKLGAVPPLPDYRGDYRPVAGDGWNSGWDRSASGTGDTIGNYRLIDAADGLAQAIGDAPPDFTFRFDGRDAWVWLSNEGEAMIVEPSPYGVIQYYYAPRAAAPYLVRDVYQSYAYEGPDFVASYGQDGRFDQRLPSPRTLDNADRLQARGRAIMAASYQRRWDDQVAESWSVQTFSGFGFGDGYGSGIGRGWSGGWQPRWREHRDWNTHRQRNREWEDRRRLNDEARDRADSAERFRQWRRDGRRGPPPGVRRGGRNGNPGADSFVQPVAPPTARPGAGPIMVPANGGSAPDVVALPTGPETPRVIRRPRPQPGMQAQPSLVADTPVRETTIDSRVREETMREDRERAMAANAAARAERAAAVAAANAIEAEAAAGRDRAMHLEAERMAREDEDRERAAADARAARQQAMAAEMAAQAAAEREEREAAQATARAETRAAAAAEAAARAAEAAAAAAEERQRARPDNVDEENVRPD